MFEKCVALNLRGKINILSLIAIIITVIHVDVEEFTHIVAFTLPPKNGNISELEY